MFFMSIRFLEIFFFALLPEKLENMPENLKKLYFFKICNYPSYLFIKLNIARVGSGSGENIFRILRKRSGSFRIRNPGLKWL